MVHERLTYYFESQGITKKEIAENVGSAYNHICNLLAGNLTLGINVLNKFKTAYPKMNSEWILFGNGGMSIDGSLQLNETTIVYKNANPNNYEKMNKILTNSLIDKEKIIKGLETQNANLIQRLEGFEKNEVIHIKSNENKRYKVSKTHNKLKQHEEEYSNLEV